MLPDYIDKVQKFIDDGYFDPDSDGVYAWQGIIAFTVLYNIWSIILRIAFFDQLSYTVYQRFGFCCLDFITDFLLMLDVFSKFRLGYLDEGIMVRDVRKLRENYKSKRKEFLSDVIAALPTDKIVIILSSLTSLSNWIFPFTPLFILEGRTSIALRLPKLFKWRSAMDFFNNSDMRTNSPNIVRAFKLLLVLATIIHWIACFYFIVSKYEGLGTNDWVLEDFISESNFFRSYLRSLYWSTMTLTTIGNTSSPKTDLEYVFTGLTFLIGVFLFAAVVGNVGDVISNMHAARVQFQLKMDSLKFYMAARRVPSDLQKRVKKWADYAWQNTHVLEDQELLDMLPYRLRSDIAQHVHLETLRKIRVFQECESGFLCELVTKLKSHVYSPMDYVCRTGEIGREMYIINNGKVEVLIRDHVTQDQTVVATLSEGNYFGEISVLRLDSGINRRNADVRSVGFSELLVLSKKDLTQVLYEYPEARVVIENYARERIVQTREVKKRKDSQEIGLVVPEDSLINERTAKEMSELQHVLRELRSFDSVSCRQRFEELEEKCAKLEKISKKQRKLLKDHGLSDLLDSSCHNYIHNNNKKTNSRYSSSLFDERKSSNYKMRKRSFIKTFQLPAIELNGVLQEPARFLTMKFQHGVDPIVLNDKSLFPVYNTGADLTDTSNESDSSQ